MSQLAICQLSVVPIRSDASDASEIVTQLLFGELVDILDFDKKKKNWCKIRCDYDGYEGWMDVRQLRYISSEQAQSYRQNHAFCLDLMGTLTNTNHFLPITMGATLPNFDGLNLALGDRHYSFSGQAVSHQKTKPSPDLIIKFARRYLYAPYLWGGRSPFGIDCSGFTQIVFKMVGIRLRRDAAQQVEQGQLVDFIDQIQPADLAFFENERGRIVHVGIVVAEHQIIHAAGQVRIDRLDHNGIFNEENGTYSHKLRLIKRFLPTLVPISTPSVAEPILAVADNQMPLF